MSGTVTNVSAGNAASFFSGVQSKGDTGASGFWATLAQCMGGAGAEGEATMSSSLSSMMSSNELLSALGSEDGEALTAVIDQWFDEPLKQLDEQLAANPDSALMAALQQWLLQTHEWLQQQNPGQQGDSAQFQNLIAQPETITIAVRDVLAQLAAYLEAPKGNAEPHQFTHMLRAALLANGTGSEADGNQDLLRFITGNGANQAAASKVAGQEDGQLQGVVKRIDELNALLRPSTANQAASGAAVVEPTTLDSNEGQPVQQVMLAGQWAMKQDGLNTEKSTPVVHADRFANEMSGFIVKQLRFSKLGSVSEAKISLYPEHLGQVDIRLTMHNGQLTARFMTEHGLAKEMLEQQMSMLRGALQTQGIQVEKIEVAQQPASSLTSSMFQEQRESNANRQQSSERQSKQRSAAASIEEAAALIQDEEQVKEALRAHGQSTFSASV
ncbi:flagellar hook-length control protein FliK [Paenibacillus alvei]|uniref:flagellar hook-length control protein FliK n=1 Tax=Paenibacillus alvei TaxID=44250 RepID=UPI0013D9C83E|nr:flagellar hook-length control protein FliK [Paenibacillus alvei]NEZ43179.1 hypothetical protein [Paenibacillus alvei]